MSKIPSVVSLPSIPPKFSSFEEVRKYFTQLNNAMYIYIDNIISEFNSMIGDGDLVMSSGSAYYLGDPGTDGSWRIIRSGNNLSIQRLESGVWVQKGSYTP